MPRRLYAKIFFFFVILIIILSVAVYFLAKPILLSIAEKELHKIFKDSSISGLNITANFIEFQDVEIKEPGSYDLKIKEARIYYSLRSIFKKKCEFYIKTINCNGLKIGDINGKIEVKNNILHIRPILVSFLGGSVKGEFNISLDENMDYELRLSSQGLEIKRLVDDMKFNEKFNMTGSLDGEFYLSGKGQEIKDIKGYFYTDVNGGILVINDKTFLENIAKQSNQPLDIIVESFRDYNYNNGILKLYIDNGNLTLDVQLNGEAGTRNLTVVLHEFTNNFTN